MSIPLYGDTELDRLSAAFVERAEALGLDAFLVSQKADGSHVTAARWTGTFTHPDTVFYSQLHKPWAREVCEGCKAFRSHCIALAEALNAAQHAHTPRLQASPSSPSTGEGQ